MKPIRQCFSFLIACYALAPALLLLSATGCVQTEYCYIVSIKAIPKDIVGADGWISPDKLQWRVVQTLSAIVGGIESGSSAGLRRWDNETITGRRYSAWGAEVTTAFAPLPPRLLEIVRSENRSTLEAWAMGGLQRSLRVRFWTERPLDQPTAS